MGNIMISCFVVPFTKAYTDAFTVTFICSHNQSLSLPSTYFTNISFWLCLFQGIPTYHTPDQNQTDFLKCVRIVIREIITRNLPVSTYIILHGVPVMSALHRVSERQHNLHDVESWLLCLSTYNHILITYHYIDMVATVPDKSLRNMS